MLFATALHCNVILTSTFEQVHPTASHLDLTIELALFSLVDLEELLELEEDFLGVL